MGFKAKAIEWAAREETWKLPLEGRATHGSLFLP